MKIILLSGGSGTRLWPLSNDVRSKQFLKLLNNGEKNTQESMIQRVVRQLKENDIAQDIIIATSVNQRDSVIAQLGNSVETVIEPSRRDTFPAICFACEYLAHSRKCDMEEPIIVMPCDAFTQDGYYKILKKMALGVCDNPYDLIVMGIKPSYASSKFGYIIAKDSSDNYIIPVDRFVEKPNLETAKELVLKGALWNGGVFAFKLGYLLKFARKYLYHDNFEEYFKRYQEYPKISFDYEVAEKVNNIGVIQYNGLWKDLGTWNTLTAELPTNTYGKVYTDGTSVNTHIINELSIPLLCLGTQNLIIAASPDGIIVSEKDKSENIKSIASQIKQQRPMFEERRWGTYTVLDNIQFSDGFRSLTKRLTLNAGCAISYQRHKKRDEVWTFIDGTGEVVINGERRPIMRGETIFIPKNQLHALKATSQLSFIEVQNGTELVEEDIERFDYNWSN